MQLQIVVLQNSLERVQIGTPDLCRGALRAYLSYDAVQMEHLCEKIHVGATPQTRAVFPFPLRVLFDSG